MGAPLNSPAPAIGEKGHDRSDQEYYEQYFCDAGCSGGNATETK
jgi:hypothetical protein